MEKNQSKVHHNWTNNRALNMTSKKMAVSGWKRSRKMQASVKFYNFQSLTVTNTTRYDFVVA